MSEQSLSDKIEGNMFRYVDVKLFIKELKEDLFGGKEKPTDNEMLIMIDKLAGAELVKNE